MLGTNKKVSFPVRFGINKFTFMFERYSDNVLEEINQDLDMFYLVMQGSIKAEIHIIDRFEGVINSDFGSNIKKLREQNLELTESFRLQVVAELESLLEGLEREIENRFLNRN
jgi:hypothetical protein